MACVGAFEHDEMIEVPVEDGRLLQLVEFVDLEPYCARRQLELGGDPHQMLERHPLDRGREALAQSRQGDAMAVMVGDHRQRGEAAFGGLGLEQRLHSPRPQPVHRAHRPIARNTGSSSTSRAAAAPSTRLALSVIPGRQVRGLPAARATSSMRRGCGTRPNRSTGHRCRRVGRTRETAGDGGGRRRISGGESVERSGRADRTGETAARDGA